MDFGLLFMTLVGSKLCMFILIGVNLQHVRRDIINDNAPRTILAAVKLHYHFRGGNQMIKSDKNLLERPYYLIYCKLLIFEVFEKNIKKVSQIATYLVTASLAPFWMVSQWEHELKVPIW